MIRAGTLRMLCAATAAAWGLLVSCAFAAPNSPRSVLLPTSAGNFGELTALACPTTAQCTALDLSGSVHTFDPGTATPPASNTLQPRPSFLTPLSCPSASQCTVVGTNYAQLTFDPSSLANALTSTIFISPIPNHLASPLTSVTCATTVSCVATDETGGAYAFDPNVPALTTRVPVNPTAALTDDQPLTCPSTQLCVLVDNSGHEITFDPTSATTPPRTEIDPQVASGHAKIGPVSCPDVAQCTFIDTAGGEVTFDPDAPAGASRHIVAGPGTNWISCPTSTQCTTVDNDGNEVTFNPQNPASATSVLIDPDAGPLTADACPATTQCTEIDAVGNQVTFNPASPSTAAPYVAHAHLTGLRRAGSSRGLTRLSFEVLAGNSTTVAGLKSLQVVLPRAWRLARSTEVRRHTLVIAQGAAVRLRSTGQQGALLITPSHAVARITVTLTAPSFDISAPAARSVLRAGHTSIKLRVQTVLGSPQPIVVPISLSALGADAGGVCTSGDSDERLPITSSNPYAC